MGKPRPVTVKEAHSHVKRQKLNVPLVKRVKKHAQPKYVPRNHVISYVCPGSVVLTKAIVDAVKRALKDKPLTNLHAKAPSAKNTNQACNANMIHLHKGEVILPPRYGKILERIMNTDLQY